MAISGTDPAGVHKIVNLPDVLYSSCWQDVKLTSDDLFDNPLY